MTDKDEVAGICLTVEISNQEERYKNFKARDVFVTEVIKHICALLNGRGGTLTVKLSKTLQESVSPNDLNDFVRTIEQQVHEITDYETVEKIKVEDAYPKCVVFHVVRRSHLCTVHYNLCVPTETQVMSLPSTENISSVKKIIERRDWPDNFVEKDSHCKNFVWKACVSSVLRESRTVQLKMIKAEPSKCVSLANRITNKSNKLINQVSAFANYKGGHIYIGIDSSTYLVEGVTINNSEANRVRNKVAKTVGKMVWPHHCLTPQKGKQWDIYFETLKDSSGQSMLNTYVIVIYVAPCPGGVFTEKPESYHVVDGSVERMSLEVWKSKLLADTHDKANRKYIILPSMPFATRLTSERRFENLAEHLQRLRKEGDWIAFGSLTNKVSALKNKDVVVFVTYQQALAAHMKKQHAKARRFLEKFRETRARNPKDLPTFKAQSNYLEAVLKRSEGLYETSYNLAKKGMNEVEYLEDVPIAAWFYKLLASLAVVRASMETDSRSRQEFINEAKEYSEKALRTAEKILRNNPTALSDLQQTVHIHLALLALNSSITGLCDISPVPDIDRIQEAQEYLTSAEKPRVGARTIAEYNICMKLLAESDLQYRLAKVFPEHSFVHLKSAFATATRARDMSRRREFSELLDYSLQRLAYLTEKLLREKFHGRCKVTEQDYILGQLILEKT